MYITIYLKQNLGSLFPIIPYPQCNMVSIFSIQVYHFIHLMRILANFWWLNQSSLNFGGLIDTPRGVLMVDEFCRAAEFVPTPGGTPLHLVATFQRGVYASTMSAKYLTRDILSFSSSRLSYENKIAGFKKTGTQNNSLNFDMKYFSTSINKKILFGESSRQIRHIFLVRCLADIYPTCVRYLSWDLCPPYILLRFSAQESCPDISLFHRE